MAHVLDSSTVRELRSSSAPDTRSGTPHPALTVVRAVTTLLIVGMVLGIVVGQVLVRVIGLLLAGVDPSGPP